MALPLSPSAVVWLQSWKEQQPEFVAARRERLWGADVPQVAYGWDDLGRALRAPGLAGAKRVG